MTKMVVVPITVGAPGKLSKCFENYMEPIRISISMVHFQKTKLLRNDRILQKMLEN